METGNAWNRELHISTAGSRKVGRWTQEKIYWLDFVERLRTPVRSEESLRAYLAMPKARQDELKDVGGFVGGALRDGRRKAANVISRDLIALDFDAIPEGGTEDVLRRLEGLGCAYVAYSTRKHAPDKPRLRAVLPTDRPVTAEEYEPLARALAKLIGIEMCDPTTFEASRLMYYPSVCADGQYVFRAGLKNALAADAMLAASYTNWHDYREWPQVPGYEARQQTTLARQQDPRTKSGVIGAFCRVYDIERAMAVFLPGVYEGVPGMPGRYTFTGGSTIGGAICYDGIYLYSHHATDPGSGKLLNAFDLVRVHKFGGMDQDAAPDTPINRLPSYTAACELAMADTEVTAELSRSNYERVTEAFRGIRPETADSAAGEASEDDDWAARLTVNRAGKPEKSLQNLELVLGHDPLIKGKILYDSFSDYLLGRGPMPWAGREQTPESEVWRWTDADDAGIRSYLEMVLGWRSRDMVDDALILSAKGRAFNPVLDYLHAAAAAWDGQKRLDTLFIDFLGAEDCEYVRAVTRKAFAAMVARAEAPGTKFDYMTVIQGPQGIGKTTLLQRVGGKWFTNSVRTFEGKEASELLQGVWLVEVGEMSAFRRTDIREIKSYLSRCDDQYRAAYARRAEMHPRRCVFFGTTNDDDYLSDPTGNRRFWPVDAAVAKPTKDIWQELTGEYIRQLWGEAYARWQAGEPLILSPELEAEAERRRQGHMDRDPWQGLIENFLDKPVPEDWLEWSLTLRRSFWSGNNSYDGRLVRRDRVCAAEIWSECLGETKPLQQRETRRINVILKAVYGWKLAGVRTFGKCYGKQRGFIWDGESEAGLKSN